MTTWIKLLGALILALLVAGGLAASTPEEGVENVPAEDPCSSSGPNPFCTGGGSGGGSTCYACNVDTQNGVIVSASCDVDSNGRTSCTATVQNGTATCTVTGGSC